jgi:3-hydroxyisobutyrate dehydrogenase-like beta-hydroxyacid dehydrogenase
MSKIAFLGLGEMGAPMASRLLRAGHELTVWNRTPERTAPLAERGALAAAAPAQAGAGADFIITMLATPDALDQVVFGDRGLAGALAAGQIFVDMSTVGLAAIRSVASRLPPGVPLVDAPVRGSVPQATDGHLEVFVGASDEDFARLRPVLEALGTVRHVGGPGSGAAMKLVVNLVLGVAIVTMGEALALGKSLALPRGLLLDVLAESPIGPMVKGKRPLVESGRYPPSFKLRHAEKDLRLVEDAAASAGRELKVAHAARSWLDEAAARGAADLDFAAVVAIIAGEEPGG